MGSGSDAPASSRRRAASTRMARGADGRRATADQGLRRYPASERGGGKARSPFVRPSPGAALMMARGRNSMADIADRVRGGGGRSSSLSRCKRRRLRSAPPPHPLISAGQASAASTESRVGPTATLRRRSLQPVARGRSSRRLRLAPRPRARCCSASGQPSFLEEATRYWAVRRRDAARLLADSGGGIGGGAARGPARRARAGGAGPSGLTAIDSMPTAREMMGIGSEWLRAPSRRRRSSTCPRSRDCRRGRAARSRASARAARARTTSQNGDASAASRRRRAVAHVAAIVD